MQDFSTFVRLLEIKTEFESILERYKVDPKAVNLRRRWKHISENPKSVVKRIDHRDRNKVAQLAKEWGELYS